jgi:uncharacterized protein (DUF1810 family)
LGIGPDTYNLQRFIDAQESTFEVARSELRAGEKRSHWMWFIFPQIRGLGSSPTARRFAISNLQEAVAYLEHPILGRRIEDCAAVVNAVRNKSVQAIFGYPDDLKFHSSATLFAEVAERFGFETTVFREALAKYFEGKPDENTIREIRSSEKLGNG